MSTEELERLDEASWNRGICCAAAFIAADHGEPSLAEDLINCLSSGRLAIQHGDEYDLERIKDSGISLTDFKA